MYAEYWNLQANPFLNIINRRFLFPSDQYEEAIARFTFLAESKRLAGVLTGPYGVGKSTVLKHVAYAVETMRNLPVICMDAIPGVQLPMARYILNTMGIRADAQTLPEALMAFHQVLETDPDSVKRTLLCIDEAHHLARDDGFYLIHYLTNLRIKNKKTETEEPLFTIILAGAPHLIPSIQNEHSLYQRMQIVFSLKPLNAAETTAYVQHHIRAVGGDIWCFEQSALDMIYHYSQGLPRKINLLGDTSLMLGYAARAQKVNGEMIAQAAEDTGMTLDMTPPAENITPPPAIVPESIAEPMMEEMPMPPVVETAPPPPPQMEPPPPPPQPHYPQQQQQQPYPGHYTPPQAPYPQQPMYPPPYPPQQPYYPPQPPMYPPPQYPPHQGTPPPYGG